MIVHDRRPNGYALIELAVVITVLAILLSLCAGMIHSLMKIDRVGRDGLEEAADVARLAQDFREDVHAASREKLDLATPGRLRCDGPGGRTIEYLVREGDILRTVREADKVRRRETYRRPSKTSARFEIDEQATRPFLRIRFDRTAANPGGSLYQDYRVDAELGRDARISTTRRDP